MLYEFNPLLTAQTTTKNSTDLTFHLEVSRADCRHYVAFTSHAWLLALSLTRRLGAVIDATAVCNAVYTNSLLKDQCPKQKMPTLPGMAERELMVVTACRSLCATSTNLRNRPDVSGATFPRVISKDFSVAPYWNLMSPV